MIVASLVLLSGATLAAAHCAEDNCLRALNATQTPGRLASARAFCATFTRAPAPANTSVPAYASEHCGGASGPAAASSLSSACSCIASSTAEASSTSRPVFVTVTPTPKFPCFNTTTTRAPLVTGTGTGAGTSSAVAKPTSTSAYNGGPPTVEPCALVSEFWAKEVSAANPSPSVGAKLAYDCLKSVPLHKEAAIALVDAIRPYLEWQSNLAYLKNPPVGYEPEAFNLVGHLEKVRERLVADGYDGEVDFQQDLFEMTAKTRDGHFAFFPDALTGVFKFGRPFALVSYAKDPLSMPVIKNFDEVKTAGDNARTVLRINGIGASAFVQSLVDRASSTQDPDAAYNYMFYSKAMEKFGVAGTFQTSGWHNYLYPGENTTVQYVTGEVRSAANIAAIQAPFFNVTDGESFYQRFCGPARSALPGGLRAPTATSKRSVAQFGQYPEPVVKSYDGAVSGYYLDGEGLEDVAILNVATFGTKSSKIFQKTVDSFFETCKDDGKSRIIVDLRMNVGGYVLQGHNLFRQFFPHIEQDGFTRWRRNEQFLKMAEGISAAGANIKHNDRNTPAIGGLWHNVWNYRADLNMTNQPFESFDAKFAPWMWAGDAYTALIRDDLNNSYTTTFDYGIDITGYGSRQNFTQPFESRDIVLLTDGVCASTCSVFASGMKIQGNVKTVVMGGRPNGGLMQGIGGTKGAQVLNFKQIFEASRNLMATVYTNLSSTQEASLSQLTSLPFQRSTGTTLNVRDQILRDDVGTGIPAQFVNEPADCRLYWTLGMLRDVREIWKAAADSAWNGGGCVAGTGFGEARPGIPSSSKATGAAPRPQTKVISALDVGLEQDLLDGESGWRPEETHMF